jgi:hypothetical protein
VLDDHRLHPFDPDTGAIGEPWQAFDAIANEVNEAWFPSADGTLLVEVHSLGGDVPGLSDALARTVLQIRPDRAGSEGQNGQAAARSAAGMS